jgi:4a-hydroxytetrahydrobiopterin dehydratase
MPDALLPRAAVSDAVADAGWRLTLGYLVAAVPVTALQQGVEVAAAAVSACGSEADEHLRVDVRAQRVELALQTRARGAVGPRDIELACAVTAALAEHGHRPAPPTGVARPVQMLELAIDALDIAAIRPFWRAVLAYGDDGPKSGVQDAIADPAGQLPTIWFQQMDAPRPQRNRIHLDIVVAHDEAERRVTAALAAGGVLVSDAAARSFWVLADIEGNEVCVCTWQDRD